MDRVHSLEQAKEWFLSNATGKVLCIKLRVEGTPEGFARKECDSFPEAKEFYEKPLTEIIRPA